MSNAPELPSSTTYARSSRTTQRTLTASPTWLDAVSSLEITTTTTTPYPGTAEGIVSGIVISGSSTPRDSTRQSSRISSHTVFNFTLDSVMDVRPSHVRASSTVIALSIVLSVLAIIVFVLVALLSVQIYKRRKRKRRSSGGVVIGGNGGQLLRGGSTRQPLGTGTSPVESNGQSRNLQNWIASATNGRTDPSSSGPMTVNGGSNNSSSGGGGSGGSENGHSNRPFRVPRKPPPIGVLPDEEEDFVPSAIRDAQSESVDSSSTLPAQRNLGRGSRPSEDENREVGSGKRHVTDPIPIPFARMTRKETDSSTYSDPLLRSDRLENKKSLNLEGQSFQERPWHVRTISDVGIPRGVKVGHIASNVPLVYFPRSHEGHLSARGSIHSGATHNLCPDGSERARTLSLPLVMSERTPFLPKQEMPRYLLETSGPDGLNVKRNGFQFSDLPTTHSVPATPRRTSKERMQVIAKASSDDPHQS
ncbi:hypothetical protein FRB91_003724 [Serendipita sp. 411]|nr:hypothetical protein FRB91_003724 [Serendipita sp. 411]